MPARSKITQLPPEIKSELDKRLIGSGFSEYEKHVEWLNSQLHDFGLEIVFSRSVLHRYGQAFEEQLASVKAATDMAVALADSVGDDAGKMSDAVVRMYQEKLFRVLLDMNSIDPESVDFVKLGRTISEITRSSVSQKKWMAEARAKANAAAEDIVKTARQSGLSEEKAEEIRKRILGIV